jgi:hypothetical protein
MILAALREFFNRRRRPPPDERPWARARPLIALGAAEDDLPDPLLTQTPPRQPSLALRLVRAAAANDPWAVRFSPWRYPGLYLPPDLLTAARRRRDARLARTNA